MSSTHSAQLPGARIGRIAFAEHVAALGKPGPAWETLPAAEQAAWCAAAQAVLSRTYGRAPNAVSSITC